jgi:hypothetical protein
MLHIRDHLEMDHAANLVRLVLGDLQAEFTLLTRSILSPPNGAL